MSNTRSERELRQPSLNLGNGRSNNNQNFSMVTRSRSTVCPQSTSNNDQFRRSTSVNESEDSRISRRASGYVSNLNRSTSEQISPSEILQNLMGSNNESTKKKKGYLKNKEVKIDMLKLHMAHNGYKYDSDEDSSTPRPNPFAQLQNNLKDDKDEIDETLNALEGGNESAALDILNNYGQHVEVVGTVESSTNIISKSKSQRIVSPLKKFISGRLNKARNQMVEYITSSTHDKKGLSFCFYLLNLGGVGYTSSSGPSTPNHQNLNHQQQQQPALQNPVQLDGRAEAQYFRNRSDLQIISGNQKLSTAHITFFTKAAIQASRNGRNTAFLDPVYFSAQPAFLHNVARYVENWHPASTTELMMPYCENDHHRYFKYVRNINSTDNATVFHTDPFGIRHAPAVHRERAQQIIDIIEGHPVTIAWRQTFIPPIARQQPGTDHCGAHLVSLIMSDLLGHEPRDIVDYDIRLVRQHLQITLDTLMNYNVIPSTIFRQVPWTYRDAQTAIQNPLTPTVIQNPNVPAATSNQKPNSPVPTTTTINVSPPPAPDQELESFLTQFQGNPLTEVTKMPATYFDIISKSIISANPKSNVAIFKSQSFSLPIDQIDATCVYNYVPGESTRFIIPFLIPVDKGSACFQLKDGNFYVLIPTDKQSRCDPATLQKACAIFEKITGSRVGTQNTTFQLPPDYWYQQETSPTCDPAISLLIYIELNVQRLQLKSLKWFDVNHARIRINHLFGQLSRSHRLLSLPFKNKMYISTPYLTENVEAVDLPPISPIPQPILPPQNQLQQPLNQKAIDDANTAINLANLNTNRAFDHLTSLARLFPHGHTLNMFADAGDDEVDSLFKLISSTLRNSRYAYFNASLFHSKSVVDIASIINFQYGYTKQIGFTVTEGVHFRDFMYDTESNTIFMIDPLGYNQSCSQRLINQLRFLLGSIGYQNTPTNVVQYQQLAPCWYQTDKISCAFFCLAYHEYLAKGYNLLNIRNFNINEYKRRCINILDEVLLDNTILPLALLNDPPTLSGPPNTVAAPTPPRPFNHPIFAPNATNTKARTHKPSKPAAPAAIAAPKPQRPLPPCPAAPGSKLLPMANAIQAKTSQNQSQQNQNDQSTKKTKSGLVSIMDVMPHLKPQILNQTTPNPSPKKPISPSKTTPLKDITNFGIDLEIKNPEYVNPQLTPPMLPKTPTQIAKEKKAESERRRRQKIAGTALTTPTTSQVLRRRKNAGYGDSQSLPSNKKRTKRDNDESIDDQRFEIQENLTGTTFLDIRNLKVKQVQAEFIKAIKLNKETIGLAQAIEVLLQITNLQLVLDDDEVNNFIDAVSAEKREAWQRSNAERRAHIVQRKNLQQSELLRNNLNEIIDMINENPTIINQIQDFKDLSQHERGITTLGFLYDILHGNNDITAPLVNQFIDIITQHINKIDRIRAEIWKAFIPIKEKLQLLCRVKIAGKRGTYDYFNRQILGFSFHSVSRFDKNKHPVVGDIFHSIYAIFMHQNDEGDYIFEHAGEHIETVKNNIYKYPWIYQFEENVPNVFADFEMESIQSTQVSIPENELLEPGAAKTFLELQIAEEKVSDDRKEAADQSLKYLKCTRARLCDDRCPKVHQQLGKQLFDAILRITQCTQNDIVPYMAKFEEKWLPLIDYHAPCFQGLRTLQRKIRNIRRLIGILAKCDKAIAECDYTLLNSLATFQCIPKEVRRILMLQDLPLPLPQTENWSNARFGDLIQRFKEADADIPNKVCQVCLRLTTASNYHILYTNDPIILKMGTTIAANEQPLQDEHGQLYYGICYYCRKSMRVNNIPKFACENGLYVDQLPWELQNLNEIEWALIKRVRPLISFTTVQPLSGYSRHPMPHFTGTMLHMANPIEENIEFIANTLPSTAHLNICVKWTPNSPRAHLVRLDRMLLALRWLQTHNMHYRDIIIDGAFRFTQNDVWFDPPQQDTDVNDLIDTTTQATIVNFNGARPTLKLDHILAERPLNRPGTALQQYYMDTMEEDKKKKVFEDHIDVKCFPELFPTGRFGIKYTRRTAIRTADYFKARLNFYDRRFSNKQYIAFCKSFKDVKAVFGPVNATFGEVKKLLGAKELVENIQSKNYDVLVDRCMNTSFKSLPGSFDFNMDNQKKLETMIDYFGNFSLFFTANPCEWDWDNLRTLIRDVHRVPNDQQIDVDYYAKIDAPMFAQYFYNRMHKFRKIMLNVNDGILGNIEHEFHHYEFQGRGATHCHMVFWIKDHKTFDGSNEAEIVQYIDKLITCRRPPPTETVAHDLVIRNQVHRCTDSCIKSRKRKGIVQQKCRYGFPYEECEYTFVNHENGVIKFKPGENTKEYYLRRRIDELDINPYNLPALIAWRGNIDIQMVIGKDTTKIIKYLTGYLFKKDFSPQHQDMLKKLVEEGLTHKQQLSLGFRFMSSHAIGLQEACHNILSQEMFGATAHVEFLSADPPNKRRHRLNTRIPNDELTEENVFAKNFVSNYYPNRDPQLHPFSVFNLFTMFRIVIRKGKTAADLGIHKDDPMLEDISEDEIEHIEKELLAKFSDPPSAASSQQLPQSKSASTVIALSSLDYPSLSPASTHAISMPDIQNSSQGSASNISLTSHGNEFYFNHPQSTAYPSQSIGSTQNLSSPDMSEVVTPQLSLIKVESITPTDLSRHAFDMVLDATQQLSEDEVQSIIIASLQANEYSQVDLPIAIVPTRKQIYSQTLYGGNPFLKSKFDYGIWHYRSPLFCHGEKKRSSIFASGDDHASFKLRVKAIVPRFYLPIISDAEVETIEEHFHRLLLLFKPFVVESEIQPLDGSYENAWHQWFSDLKRIDPIAAQAILNLIENKHKRLVAKIELAEERRLHELKELQAVDIDPTEEDDNSAILAPFKKKEIDHTKHAEAVANLNADQEPVFRHILDGIAAQVNFDPTKDKNKPAQILQIISGVAGVGKSYFIDTLNNELIILYAPDDEEYMNPIVILGAPTAFAAKKINGSTLHSIFGIGRDTTTHIPLSKTSLNRLRTNFKEVKTLVFDETSMIGSTLFGRIHLRCQEITGRNDLPFGGMNVIVTGDLCQLPPVLDTQIFKPISAANAKRYFNNVTSDLNLWRKFTYAEFSIQQRQANELEFAGLLGRFRIGTATVADFDLIKTRLIPAARHGPTSATQQAEYYIGMLKEDPKAIALFPTRLATIAFNTSVMDQMKLTVIEIWSDDSDAKLTSKSNMTRPWQSNDYSKQYNRHAAKQAKKDLKELEDKYKAIADAVIETDPDVIAMNEEEKLKDDLIAKITADPGESNDQRLYRKQLASDTAALPELLRVAIGARVMLKRNLNVAAGLLNGAQGTLVDIWGTDEKNMDDTSTFHADYLIIEFDHDPKARVQIARETAVYYIDKSRTKKVTRSQFPIQVAYGVTIHKAQGMDVDNALLSLQDCFAQGQAYVALSRVRTLAGLHICSWDDNCMMVNDEAVEEYNRLRETINLPPYPTAAERLTTRNQNQQQQAITVPPPVPQIQTSQTQQQAPAQPQNQTAHAPIVSKQQIEKYSMAQALTHIPNGQILRLHLINDDRHISFANASFQALRVIPELLTWLNQHQNDSLETAELHDMCLNIGTSRTGDMTNIKNRIPNYAPDSETDALVFLQWFFDQLDDEIKSQFLFHEHMVFTCEECNQEHTIRLENQVFFQLDLTKTQQSFNQLLESIKHGFDNNHECPKCHAVGAHRIVKRLVFPPITRPRYLITVLKRFEENSSKINAVAIGQHKSTHQIIEGKEWNLISAVQAPLSSTTHITYNAWLKDPKPSWIKIVDDTECREYRVLPNNLERMYILIYKETPKRSHMK